LFKKSKAPKNRIEVKPDLESEIVSKHLYIDVNDPRNVEMVKALNVHHNKFF